MILWHDNNITITAVFRSECGVFNRRKGISQCQLSKKATTWEGCYATYVLNMPFRKHYRRHGIQSIRVVIGGSPSISFLHYTMCLFFHSTYCNVSMLLLPFIPAGKRKRFLSLFLSFESVLARIHFQNEKKVLIAVQEYPGALQFNPALSTFHNDSRLVDVISK